VGLILLLLFATLPERPLSLDALAHFPADLLARGRRFSREARLAATLRDLVALGAMLWLCFHSAGVRWLQRLEGLGRGRLWPGLAAVFAGITALSALAELPFSFYLGYVHEHAYGLSRLTAGQWLADWTVQLALHFGLSLLIWLPMYWLIRRWPRGWWVPAVALNVAFAAMLPLLTPVLLLPMEGKLVDVQDPQTLAMVRRVADRAGVPVERVRQLQVSGRTSRANAMVTGLGPTKQVIFYDTLLRQFTPAEVEVVMAHELARSMGMWWWAGC